MEGYTFFVISNSVSWFKSRFETSFSRSAGQTDRKTLIRTLPLYLDRWPSVVGGKLEKSFDLRLINNLHYSFTCLVIWPWHLTHNVITWKTKMFWICEHFFKYLQLMLIGHLLCHGYDLSTFTINPRLLNFSAHFDILFVFLIFIYSN